MADQVLINLINTGVRWSFDNKELLSGWLLINNDQKVMVYLTDHMIHMPMCH